jgi:hypothetical protein
MVCKLAILPQSLPGFENSAGTSAFEQRGSFLLCLGFRKLSAPQKKQGSGLSLINQPFCLTVCLYICVFLRALCLSFLFCFLPTFLQ